MNTSIPNTIRHSEAHAASHDAENQRVVFGFWLYLMTDCFIFAALFATFGVLGQQIAGGPSARELFDMRNVEWETGALLLSSITYGFAMLGAHARKPRAVFGWLLITALLGLCFLDIEVREFAELIARGAGPDRSAFLSSFFVLVGTHGLHVTIGLLWMAVLMVQVLLTPTLSATLVRRLTCLSLFWHFLDIVWICVFTFVYLGGVI